VARISLPALPTCARSALFAVDQHPTPVDADSDGFQLDLRIVEADPVAAALLGDTDNGCDTVRGQRLLAGIAVRLRLCGAPETDREGTDGYGRVVILGEGA